MRLDFPRLEKTNELIVIRPGDDAWGPYSFDVSGAVPSGVTVSSVTATAYLDSSGTYTEAATLIEPGSVSATGDTTIQLKMQAASLEAGTYYLKITLTLSNSGVKSLLFGPVYVESLA